MKRPSSSHAAVMALAILSMSRSGAYAVEPPSTRSNESVLETRKREEIVIPKESTPPPLLGRPLPKGPYVCQRMYEKNGRLYACDTHLGRDGERLKPLFEGVPEAYQAIEDYQNKRSRAQTAAYVASAGVLILFGSFLVRNQVEDPNTRLSLFRFGILGGAAIAIGAGTYSAVTTLTSQGTLDRAMEAYNAARPNAPIQFKFTTSFEIL